MKILNIIFLLLLCNNFYAENKGIFEIKVYPNYKMKEPIIDHFINKGYIASYFFNIQLCDSIGNLLIQEDFSYRDISTSLNNTFHEMRKKTDTTEYFKKNDKYNNIPFIRFYCFEVKDSMYRIYYNGSIDYWIANPNLFFTTVIK